MSVNSQQVTKEDLINFIKEWLQIEKDVKLLQKQIKEKRERKKELTDNLVNIMKTNEIECFDINNGKLLYTKNKVKGTINKPYLLSALSKYFENNPDIHADEVSQFILENRGEKIKEGIRCKLNKI
jgi:hypothetical protein